MKENIEMYIPGRHFPAISVTGGRCELQCDHCRGHHLKGMEPAERDDDMVRYAENVLTSGGTGMLISGGCDMDGKVPVAGHADVISKISGMGLKVNVHPGFLTKEEASLLVHSGVDRFSVDVHQSPEIIRNVLHLNTGPAEYEDTIDNIISASGKVVPHLTVGFGTEDMMMSAELILSKGIRDVVLLALVPTKGTEINEHLPEEGVLHAIGMLMDMGLNVTLGCMRPRIYPDLEMKAIGMGVRRIANPSLATIRRAQDSGYGITTMNECCGMF